MYLALCFSISCSQGSVALVLHSDAVRVFEAGVFKQLQCNNIVSSLITPITDLSLLLDLSLYILLLAWLTGLSG